MLTSWQSGLDGKVVQNVTHINGQFRLPNVSIGTGRPDRHDGRVTLPPPPAQRNRVVSFRFSDEELERIDRATEELKQHWKRDKVERADVVRAGLTLLFAELDRNPPNSTEGT